MPSPLASEAEGDITFTVDDDVVSFKITVPTGKLYLHLIGLLWVSFKT
jgi:hypothetical protein